MKLNYIYFNVVIQNPILPSVLYTSDITAKLNGKKEDRLYYRPSGILKCREKKKILKDV